MKSELAKKAGLNFTVGIGFIVTQLIVALVLGSIFGLELSNSIKDLGQGFGELNGVLIGVTFFSFVITGTLIVLWAKLRGHLAPHFGLQRSEPPKLNTSKKLALILTLFVVGIITSMVFYGFEQFIEGISPDVRLDSPGTFLDAVLTFNPMIILGGFLTIMVFGALVVLLSKAISPVQSRLPNQVQR